MKINPRQLEAAHGLRIAVVPSFQGRSDAIALDEQRNLVICPMPYDGSFMQVFYEGWQIVQALCERDFELPRDVDLPSPAHRQVARVFIDRRDFPAIDVLDATKKFAQPELLVTKDELVPSVTFATTASPGTTTIVTPYASQASLI